MNIDQILKRKFVLASKSARRIKLLQQIGINFISVDSKIKEVTCEDCDPVGLVKVNSESKSRKLTNKYYDELVIGADTIVVIDNEILNKPKSLKQAEDFLKRLSNNKHTVFTGINLIDRVNNKEYFTYEKTSVYFRNINFDEIKYYVNKYKPLDKAGAYGIQDDFGCIFIKKIIGDYYNVVGFPLAKFYECLIQKF